MVLEGKRWILQQTKAIEIDFANYKEQVEQVLDGIEQLTLVGGELLLGGIFDQIGFNAIKDELFRVLVLSRLLYPASSVSNRPTPHVKYNRNDYTFGLFPNWGKSSRMFLVV